MVNTDYFANKKITVVGFARSGVACANLLYSLGADVSITDNSDTDLVRESLGKLNSDKISVELGRHTPEFIKQRDLVVASPGVPNSSPALIFADSLGIPVISEIEAAAILCPATIIAVTGSNGKTTVTTLIGKILEANGDNVFICGNIGRPFSSQVEKMKKGDFVSLEISSFQLERIAEKFKPKVSVILNFSPNHLDRYGSILEYLGAKKRIFINQDETDYLVLNYLDPVVKELSKESKAKIEYFSETEELNPNQAASYKVASILGIDKEAVSKVFNDFRGIEHRLEYAGEINNIKFINDSKSTTVESAIWALKNIHSPIIWIAGGRHKGVDYSVILDYAKNKVKQAVLIGESAQIIQGALNGVISIERADTLVEAVRRAYIKAIPGDSILFSPMCSSFDMFLNYEERGRCFKKTVDELIEGYK